MVCIENIKRLLIVCILTSPQQTTTNLVYMLYTHTHKSTEDIEHFSNEEFLANGFTCMNNFDNEKKTQSPGLTDGQYNVWCYKNPEIIIIQNSFKPTDLPLEISAKNVEKEDVDEWLALFLRQYDVSSQTNLLQSLITWIKSYLEMAVANNIDVDLEYVNNSRVGRFVPNEYTLENLPSLQEMEKAIGRPIETGRKLHVITWGDKKERKSTITQLGAEAHFNAKPLDGRGGGANLKVNATHDPRIVRNVVQSMTKGVGAMWLERTVNKIEQSNLHCISTFCAQGRHRSVSSALILKAKYYPNATLQHIKMK